MTRVGNESALIEKAQAVIGDEPVLVAGMFGCQDLVASQVAGGTLGAMTLAQASPLAAGAGVAVGGYAMRAAEARSEGMTLKLLVAVTASAIYVLNWTDDHGLDAVHQRFDRATTTVKVDHFGLSRIVTLADTASGAQMRLHGSAAKYMHQSGPDTAVITELSRAA